MWQQDQASLPEPPPISFVSNRAVTSRRGSVVASAFLPIAFGFFKGKIWCWWLGFLFFLYKWNLMDKSEKSMNIWHLLALDWSTSNLWIQTFVFFWSFRTCWSVRVLQTGEGKADNLSVSLAPWPAWVTGGAPKRQRFRECDQSQHWTTDVYRMKTKQWMKPSLNSGQPNPGPRIFWRIRVMC